MNHPKKQWFVEAENGKCKMPNGISKETFEGMDSDSKLNVLYDLAVDQHECTCRLESKFDKRQKYDLTIAGMMGFVGGFIAHLVGWIRQ